MRYPKISGFSDEIAEDVDTQFAVLGKLGIRYFEPRGVDGKNIADLSEEEVSRLGQKMEEKGIRVSSIGSPIGKVKLEEDFGKHLNSLSGWWRLRRSWKRSISVCSASTMKAGPTGARQRDRRCWHALDR